MRIVAGKYGGRRLNTPKNNAIRPTSDKVRQAMFNSLLSRNIVQGAIVLDAFCGSGALGIEALSQGAARCLFIDKNAPSLTLAKQNVETVGASQDAQFLLADSTKLKPRGDKYSKATLVFLDPPYDKNMINPTLDNLISGDWVEKDAFFVIETDKSEVIFHSNLDIQNQKKYGDTMIWYATLNL